MAQLTPCDLIKQAEQDLDPSPPQLLPAWVTLGSSLNISGAHFMIQ